MTESGESSENLEGSSPERDESEGATSGSLIVARRTRRCESTAKVSLLIEALIRTVTSAYGIDAQKATRVYTIICKKLFRMGLIDESWTMRELEGARVQLEHVLCRLFGGILVSAPFSPILLQGSSYISQYRREFDECEKIGQGAFGKVFRVKHKLDSREYAVKKIPIRSSTISSIKDYLSEVKTFASLNHPNIVQYRAAWFELEIESKARDFSLQGDNSPNSFSDSSGSDDSPANANTRSFKNDVNDSKSDFEVVFQRSSGGDPSKRLSSRTTKSLPPAKAFVATHQNGIRRPKMCWATLYIQMTLCHGTLDLWLRQAHESFNPKVAVVPCRAQTLKTNVIQEILIQILKGLEYIHSKNVVHHDIKPSNIFVSAEGDSLLVQLGDFGLACPKRSRHCFARGTPLYAAPEQLASFCDPKSDIYSVGIVLFELLEDFSTDMERIRRITELRARKDSPIPTELTLINLVPALVRHRPAERPDATTLLKALEGHATPDVKVLQKLINEKDEEIRRLRKLLRSHGVSDF